MVNMFFGLTFSNIQCLSQAFKLEQSERTVQVQVLEDDPTAINLSQQVALMLCALVCIPRSIPGAMTKSLPARVGNARDVGSMPGVGKITWSRKWQHTQYSCLENSMGRGLGGL